MGWGLCGCLVPLHFFLELRVTSGIAFLHSFSRLSGYLCSVTLGTSQDPVKVTQPAYSCYISPCEEGLFSRQEITLLWRVGSPG